eukprot:2817645-Amphidinium_carterae.1
MFDFEELHRAEVRVYKPIVPHQDASDAAWEATSTSVDHLLWHSNAGLAKAVTLFGPAVVVLPMFAAVSGVEGQRSLRYAEHPRRLSEHGLLDKFEMESKFGSMDPAGLIEELCGGKRRLEQHLSDLSDELLQDEVRRLQDWKLKAAGRLKLLETRAAWALLGLPAGVVSNQAAIRKAFKKRALELHPDKGGDPARFQLLQEMKNVLIEPLAHDFD